MEPRGGGRGEALSRLRVQLGGDLHLLVPSHGRYEVYIYYNGLLYILIVYNMAY